MRIDWDLSGAHTLDQVTWQKENLDISSTSLEPVESVRIGLPGGEVLRMRDRVKRIILYRPSGGKPLPGSESEILEQVEVYSEPMSVEDAYRRALAYADQFDLPRAPLKGWRKRRDQNVDPVTDRTGTTVLDRRLGGKGGPIPYVELNYSSNDDRPWIPSVQLYWPPPREG